MKARLVVAVSVAMSLVASSSFAGDYHFNSTLICSDCHVMHYSQTHGYNANGSGNHTALGAGGPYGFLLRNDINDLCTSCHDGQTWAPDVVEANAAAGIVRQAGALNVVGGNGQYPPATGHTLGSTATAPGSNPAWSNPAGLECTDCHGAHGRAAGLASTITNGGYRNLFRETTGFTSISYSRGDVEVSNDLTRWVFETQSSGNNTNHYTDFHGAMGGTEVGGTAITGGWEDFHRHPAAGANIGALGGGHSSKSRFVGRGNNVQVMSAAGHKPGTYVSTDADLSMSCMSCHKGHGNQNAFGLIYMLGTGTVTEQGDNGIDARNLCRQCHSMGGSSTTW
jgi:predicted CXXCH cytochrome family protein